MEHDFRKSKGLPMLFTLDKNKREMTFASDDMIMENDTVLCIGYNGTIKEVIEERACRGRWADIGDGHSPQWYKCSLY